MTPKTKRTLIHLAAAALTSLALAGCGSSTPAEHVAAAKEYIAKGELKTATIELSSALQQDPNLIEARSLLAQVHMDMGEGAGAEKELRRAIELGLAPESAQLQLLKAIVLQGDMDRILSESDSIDPAVSDKDRAAILGMRGQALADKRELERAGDTLREALGLDPKSVPALIGMSLLHAAKREYEEAREWIDRALDADPASAESWSLLGQIELEQGNAAEAETALSKAIELRKSATLELAKRALARAQLDKFADAESDIAILKGAGFEKNPYVNYVNGVNQFRQKKYAEAVEAFEASKMESPPYLPREYYLASAYMMLGRYEQALRQAELVNSMAPRSREAKRLLGAVQISQSELAAATDVLSKAVVESPEDAVMLRMLGYVALLVGNTAQAVQYYERALAAEPDSAETRESLALAKLMDGQGLDAGAASQLGEAVTGDDSFAREFLKALEAFRDGKLQETLKQAQSLNARYPDSVEPLKLMAACYLSAGQWETAKDYLQKALDIEPDEPAAAKNLAKLELEADNPDAARTLLSGVVKAHPEDEEALVSLARLESRLDSPEAGMRLLEEAAERNPGALLVRSELARAYQRAGRHDRVLEVTQNLGKKEFTKMPALLELRGVALMGTGDFVSAQGAFKQWSDLEPESARAHFLYGESLARAGNVNGASAELKRALELDAAYLPARVGEIKMLVSRNDVGAAGERLVALRKEFGPRREVLGIEGWFALGTNDFVTAADRFSTLLEDQRDTELMVLYIRSLWAQKKYDEAIEKMQAWLETDPKDLVVEIHLADAFVSLGRNDEARAAYARVVEQYPDNLPALNNLATLGQEQDLAGSIKYAEHAYKLAPHDPIVMDTLGALLQKGGDRARGERLIQDAARLAPEDAQIQVHFAKVLADNGRTAEAKQVLEKVIDNAGDSRAATAARAALESLP